MLDTFIQMTLDLLRLVFFKQALFQVFQTRQSEAKNVITEVFDRDCLKRKNIRCSKFCQLAIEAELET